MRLSRLFCSLSLLGLAALGLNAYAEHATGFYLEGQGAWDLMNSPKLSSASVTDSSSHSYTVNSSRTSYMVGAGVGYLFNLNPAFDLGPELGYNYYGNYKFEGASPTTGSITHTIDSWNAYVVAHYFWEQMLIGGRLGIGYFPGHTSGSLTNGSNTVNGLLSHSEINPIAGLNLGYAFTPQFSVSLTCDYVFGSKIDASNWQNNKAPSMTLIGLGLAYAFGNVVDVPANDDSDAFDSSSADNDTST